MQYHILHDFGTSITFKEKSSDQFKVSHNLKLLTKFDVIMRSSPEGVMPGLISGRRYKITPARNEAIFALKFVRKSSL